MRFTLIYFLSFANQRKKRTRSMTCPNLGGAYRKWIPFVVRRHGRCSHPWQG